MKLRNVQCVLCERFNGDYNKPTCEAFPDGIPEEIWNGVISHNKTFREEKLLFKPLEEILV